MKKILLFLTLSFIYLISTTTVNADSDRFYEAEYIDNIYMVKYDKTTKSKYYQKARMYRRTSDGRIAYCLQPFTKFNTNDNIYETTASFPNINNESLNKIIDIIGFGYGYKGHTDDLKWYAITQLMIWQIVEPNNEFYFTDTLNGNKIEPYNSEIAEINNLINQSYIMPSFNNQTFYGIVGKTLAINDTNNVLQFYEKNNNTNTVLNGNNLTITKNQVGCYEENFYRKYDTNSDPVLFYYNPNSQHLGTIGKPNNRNSKIRYCFKELNLKIKKIDKDTGSTTTSGEASLKDTTFTLYNNEMEKITDLNLNNNIQIDLSSNNFDLTYGTYYLKETKAGTGYLPNNETYKIEFTPENTNIELTIENEVLKKEVVIKKYYGDGKLMIAEPNISFEIYDNNNNLVDTITTDQNGLATITLPYGHYRIVQINTTEGYTKIEPFEIFISNINKNYHYTINDYKNNEEQISIEVPNTSTNKNNYPISNLIVIPFYYLVKKKLN